MLAESSVTVGRYDKLLLLCQFGFWLCNTAVCNTGSVVNLCIVFSVKKKDCRQWNKEEMRRLKITEYNNKKKKKKVDAVITVNISVLHLVSLTLASFFKAKKYTDLLALCVSFFPKL